MDTEQQDANQAFGALADWPRCERCGIYERWMRAYLPYGGGVRVFFCQQCRATPKIGCKYVRVRGWKGAIS